MPEFTGRTPSKQDVAKQLAGVQQTVEMVYNKAKELRIEYAGEIAANVWLKNQIEGLTKARRKLEALHQKEKARLMKRNEELKAEVKFLRSLIER